MCLLKQALGNLRSGSIARNGLQKDIHSSDPLSLLETDEKKIEHWDAAHPGWVVTTDSFRPNGFHLNFDMLVFNDMP